MNITSVVSQQNNSLTSVSLKAKMKRAGHLVLKGVQDTWGGLEKAFGIAKNGLNVRLQLRNWYPMRATDAAGILKGIQGMKLFTGLNFPLNAIELPRTAKEIAESVKLKDKEGAILGSMTFAVLVTDMYDAVTTAVNASLVLSSRPALGGVVAVLGTPLVMGMVGVNAIKKTVQLWNIRKLEKEIECLIKGEATDKSPEEFRKTLLEFLNQKLNVQGRKTKRDTDSTTVSQLEALKRKIESKEKLEQQDIIEIGKAVRDIRASIKYVKKSAAWVLGAFSVMFVAFSLFYSTIPLAIPFTMLALAFIVRFAAWADQKRVEYKLHQTQKLSNPPAL